MDRQMAGPICCSIYSACKAIFATRCKKWQNTVRKAFYFSVLVKIAKLTMFDVFKVSYAKEQ